MHNDMLALAEKFDSPSCPRNLDFAHRIVSAKNYPDAGRRAQSPQAVFQKPTQWTGDIFIKDVCNALEKVGVPVLMHPDPELSHAQSLAKRIVEAVGLPVKGKLFKQMQRARRIQRLG